jgi:molecular chaperone GrpE
MNDPASNWELSENSVAGDESSPAEPAPQFGAVDIVEAFIAMRHEWRGQTKECRALAHQIDTAVENMQSLEAKLLARIAESIPEQPSQSLQLVQLIVETDHQFARAVQSLEQWHKARREREDENVKAIERFFANMNPLARWFARPLCEFMTAQGRSQPTKTQDSAIEGLSLVLGGLRRAMNEHHIERIDVRGQPFDPNTMYAVGSVDMADCLSGHVAEQLSAAYRWRGQIVRFAEVRVAK